MEFVRRFRPLIAGVIVKRFRRRTQKIPNLSLIEDLTQETYVKLSTNNFRPLRTFDFRHENALCGFLKVIATNVVEDYVRSVNADKHGQGREEEVFDQIAYAVPAPPQSVDRKILMDQIKKCLQEEVNERDYTIFWLYYRQGLTAKAISELPSIQLTVKGVESTLLRLIKLVQAKLTVWPKRKGTSGR